MRMTADNARTSQATELLLALARANSINPMGREYSRGEPVERQAIEVVESWLQPYRDRLTLERQSCGHLHENLVITLVGRPDVRAALFESHLDTVPADDWPERALQPVIEDGKLIARGACDDKGSMAAMVLALCELLESGATPPRTIVLVCAGDEEYGQTGIRHFIRNTSRDFAFAVFGEPTRLQPVVQHKGTVRWDVTVHGESAHTSRPDLGRNAVLGMVEVVSALGRYQDHLQQTWTSPLMTGPLVTVTMIQGGRTRNATPDECTIAVDFRILPGMEPELEKQLLIEYLNDLGWRITHGPNQLMTPPLNTNPDSSFCQMLLETCRELVDGEVALRGEPYGTDAAWVSDRCPCVVLGPGDIAYAHAVDEQISLDEVAQAVELYKRLMQLEGHGRI